MVQAYQETATSKADKVSGWPLRLGFSQGTGNHWHSNYEEQAESRIYSGRTTSTTGRGLGSGTRAQSPIYFPTRC